MLGPSEVLGLAESGEEYQRADFLFFGVIRLVARRFDHDLRFFCFFARQRDHR